MAETILPDDRPLTYKLAEIPCWPAGGFVGVSKPPSEEAAVIEAKSPPKPEAQADGDAA